MELDRGRRELGSRPERAQTFSVSPNGIESAPPLAHISGAIKETSRDGDIRWEKLNLTFAGGVRRNKNLRITWYLSAYTGRLIG